MIKIVADSTCDLSREIIDKYNIGIAPISIRIDNKNYLDGSEMTADEFYELLPNLKELPTTSMAGPEVFLKLIHQAIADGYTEILCICMSSGTSASYQANALAKNMFYEENPDSKIKIHVVDSLAMSHGSGWLIMKTAQLMESGYTFDELVDFNEKNKIRVKHLLCVDDLNNLIKSGRLSNASGIIGKLLRVKPIMTMKNGKGAIVAKERGRNRVLQHYVDKYIKRVDQEMTNFIIIGYTSDIGIAQELEKRFRSKTDFKGEVFIMQMGPGVGTHVGLGGLSMYFMEKENLKDGLVGNKLQDLKEKKDELMDEIKHMGQ